MEICKNIIYKAKNVIFNPTEFFEEIEGEEGIKKPLIYLAILQIVPAIFSYVLLRFNIAVVSAELGNSLPIIGVFTIFLAIFTYVRGVISGVLMAAIVHVFALIFGGSGDFNSTFKSIIYGSTPVMLAGWVPILGIIAWLDALYLEVKGISKLHDVSGLKALGILLIPGLIFLGIIVVAVLFYYGMFGTTSTVVSPSQLPVGNFLRMVR